MLPLYKRIVCLYGINNTINQSMCDYTNKRFFYTVRLCVIQCTDSHEKAVCLSVRPSIKRVDCDKTKESYAHILIPHERWYSFLT